LLVLILAVDVLALEVADSRMYDLLDGLGGDSTEVLRCALDLDHIPGSSTGHVLLSLLDSHLGVRILNMLHDILYDDDLHLAGRGVQLDAYIFFAIRILFVDRCQCILDGCKHGVSRNTALRCNLRDRGIQITLHAAHLLFTFRLSTRWRRSGPASAAYL